MPEDNKHQNTNQTGDNAKSLKAYARQMRNNSTKGEIKFWCELIRKRKSGYQFYGQFTIHKYIVDFYCAKLKLVIEIDGTSHDDKKEYDARRTKYLEGLGLKVIRYNDLMVLKNFHNVEGDFGEQIKMRAGELGLL